MNRRAFLGALAIARLSPRARLKPRAPRRRSEREPLGERSQSLTSEGWKISEIRTHVHVQNASGVTHVWLPTPLVGAAYQQTLGDTYVAENGRVVMVEGDEFDVLLAEWGDGADPVLDLTSRVATRSNTASLTTPTVAPPADFTSLERFLRPTRLYPIDGPLKAFATEAGRGASTDIERARAIFTRIAASGSSADAPARGLTEAQCADRSALFAAACRAAGIPARAIYGLRLVSPGAADATRAQASRAEVYLVGFGWVPVDVAASTFGTWDGRWVAFNAAQDLTLPKTKHAPLPFFMHPQAETANGFVNGLDAAAFRYDITVRDAL
ncbi:MAG TPA: transglutaminase-like domain-containing protein [Vicinamibacterales bacterium]|nr:transglutaminase-like domain-containing protein [Vicinamibacterales bacterium]